MKRNINIPGGFNIDYMMKTTEKRGMELVIGPIKDFQGKRILVSGGENFFGRMVALRLTDLGADVSIALSEENEPQPLEASLSGRSAIKTDSLNSEQFKGGVQAILFLNNPEILSNNQVDKSFLNGQMTGLINLLRLAGRHYSYFIYASSMAVYGKQKYLPIDEEHPLEPFLLYGAAKLAGEYFSRAAALDSGFLYTILRFGDLYGPGSGQCGDPAVLLESAIGEKPLIIKGKGRQVKSYLFIDDAVDATIKVISSKTANQTLNIAGNDCISTWHLASLIKQYYSPRSEIKTTYDPLQDEIECCIDSSKAEGLIGFKPGFNLIDGLARTYRWLISENRKQRTGCSRFPSP